MIATSNDLAYLFIFFILSSRIEQCRQQVLIVLHEQSYRVFPLRPRPAGLGVRFSVRRGRLPSLFSIFCNMSHDLTTVGLTPDAATDKDTWELDQLSRGTKMPAANESDHHRYDDPSEATPFIAKPSTPSVPDDDALGLEDPRDKYKWSVIVLSFSIAFMLELGMGVSMPAWNALLEKGLCSETYPDISIGDDNPLCKDPTVQGKLAMYRGWTVTLEALPSMSDP